MVTHCRGWGCKFKMMWHSDK